MDDDCTLHSVLHSSLPKARRLEGLIPAGTFPLREMGSATFVTTGPDC